MGLGCFGAKVVQTLCKTVWWQINKQKLIYTEKTVWWLPKEGEWGSKG